METVILKYFYKLHSSLTDDIIDSYKYVLMMWDIFMTCYFPLLQMQNYFSLDSDSYHTHKYLNEKKN